MLSTPQAALGVVVGEHRRHHGADGRLAGELLAPADPVAAVDLDGGAPGCVKSPPPVDTSTVSPPATRFSVASAPGRPRRQRQAVNAVTWWCIDRARAVEPQCLASSRSTSGDLADRRAHPAELGSARRASASRPAGGPRRTRRPRFRRRHGGRRARAAWGRSRRPTRPAPPPATSLSHPVAWSWRQRATTADTAFQSTIGTSPVHIGLPLTRRRCDHAADGRLRAASARSRWAARSSPTAGRR